MDDKQNRGFFLISLHGKENNVYVNRFLEPPNSKETSHQKAS